MRPDPQPDPRPEFGMPVPRDASAARYDDAPSGPVAAAPWSGPQPASGPWSGPQPAAGPWSGPHQAVGPWSGPHQAAAPWSGPHQAAAPWSGPQQAAGSWAERTTPPGVHGAPQPVGAAAGRTAAGAAWSTGDRLFAGDGSRSAEPAARRSGTSVALGRSRAEEASDDAAYDDSPAYGLPAARRAAEPRDAHPSGPLPSSGHRMGSRTGGGGRRRVLLAVVAAVAVVVGAAGYAAVTRYVSGPTSAAVAPVAGAQVAPAGLTGPNLGTRQTPIGLVATTDGYTVYQFTKDSNKPSASTCTGACAETWPPVLAGDTPWLKGVQAGKVGTVARPDGTQQMTLNGWPLYRYAKDAAKGDTAGNGVGGTWKAVGPDGKPVAAAAAPAAGAGTSGSGASAGSGSASGSGSGSGSGSAGGYGAASPAAPAPAPADSYGSSGY